MRCIIAMVLVTVGCARVSNVAVGDSGNNSKVVPDVGIVDRCAGDACDWCAKGSCPELCEVGSCNTWAPDPADFDADGIDDALDNCPFISNETQRDSDADGFGDACDACAKVEDPKQLDADGDGEGDLCDGDMDNDGILNTVDNCPLAPNPQQINTDMSDQGDVCDADDDNDGYDDSKDNCPLVANPEQLNSDVTKYGDACDSDADGDQFLDSEDNCPTVPNDKQLDADKDGIGDLCDGDIDNDGVANIKDNCPATANPKQQNADRDHLGDACDPKFCYVVRNASGASGEKNCLDPTATFRVYAPDLLIGVGVPWILQLYANREDAEVTYTWAISERPASSKVTVIAPRGKCRANSLFACLYTDKPAGFIADEPGVYTITVNASLEGEDPANPNWPTESSFVMTVTAEGSSGSTICIPDDCFN